jgi:hypothetical protein
MHPLRPSVLPMGKLRSIVGMLPTIECPMRLFQSADAVELTGLTRSQLREWCGRGRRGLIAPDVNPEGPGRHALFSWQTLLVLRVLRVLQVEYAIELGPWAPAVKELRAKLDRTPFPSLWQIVVYFPNRESALLTDRLNEVGRFGGIVVPLEPHLVVLATGLSLPRADQLPLFPPMAVS